jgi:formylglycine-generating enzyme required for sulfatase activity
LLPRASWISGLVAAGLAMAVAAAWWAPLVLRVQSPEGTVLVEIDSAKKPIAVSVAEDRTLTIADPNDGQPIRVTVHRDKRQLQLEKQGFQLAVKSFRLDAPDGGRIEVTFLPLEAPLNGAPAPVNPTPASAPWSLPHLDGPPRAVAPFTPEEAARHQKAWAAHLDVPVEFTNSLGMEFRLIPPGEYPRGLSDQEYQSLLDEAKQSNALNAEWYLANLRIERPPHRVVLTRPLYLAVHEVTQQQYEQVLGTNPSSFSPAGSNAAQVAGLDTSRHPVEQVTWNEAVEFCLRLTARERLQPSYRDRGEGWDVVAGEGYRLPTEAEWEFACRGGAQSWFWFGDVWKTGLTPVPDWEMTTSGGRTHPVGLLLPNPFGLYDTHGNVQEWCTDERTDDYAAFADQPAVDPLGRQAGQQRAVRGGYGREGAILARVGLRYSAPADYRSSWLGFRPVLPLAVVQLAVARQAARADEPPRAIAPFDAEAARDHQRAWAEYLGLPEEYTNPLGMQFRLVPPGDFLRGTPDDELDRLAEHGRRLGLNDDWILALQSEGPEHRVVLTQSVYLGIHEVTQAQFLAVVGHNPSAFSPSGKWRDKLEDSASDTHPVERVSWLDAADFCDKLSGRQGLVPHYRPAASQPATGEPLGYRLPTEAQWEFACRAGTATRYWYGDFWFGDKEPQALESAWFSGNSGGRTHAVGERRPNPFGLFDMLGNVDEWCHDASSIDAYERLKGGLVIDPQGQADPAADRVRRGGNWADGAFLMRSSVRPLGPPAWSNVNIGFRVALPVEAVRHSLAQSPPPFEKQGSDAPISEVDK